MKKVCLIFGVTVMLFLVLFGHKGGWFNRANPGDVNPNELVEPKTEYDYLPDYDSAWEDGLLTEMDSSALDALWESGDQHLTDGPGGLTLGLLANDSALQDFPGRLPVSRLESIIGDRIVSIKYIRFGKDVEYYAVIDQYGNGADVYHNTLLGMVTFFNIGLNHDVLQKLPKKHDENSAMLVALKFLNNNNINSDMFELVKSDYIDSLGKHWFEWANEETKIQTLVSSALGRVVVYTANPVSEK